jgi:tRNA A-37 threonylcarbamoyl transferase component Bud32
MQRNLSPETHSRQRASYERAKMPVITNFTANNAHGFVFITDEQAGRVFRRGVAVSKKDAGRNGTTKFSVFNRIPVVIKYVRDAHNAREERVAQQVLWSRVRGTPCEAFFCEPLFVTNPESNYVVQKRFVVRGLKFTSVGKFLEKKAYSPEEKVRIRDTLAHAVACMHGAHVIHEDAHWDNMLIGWRRTLKSGFEFQLKIIDFGFAVARNMNTNITKNIHNRAYAYGHLPWNEHHNIWLTMALQNMRRLKPPSNQKASRFLHHQLPERILLENTPNGNNFHARYLSYLRTLTQKPN